MKKIIFITLLALYSQLLLSQLIEIKKFENIDVENFYIDKLENIYLQKNNSILKTNKNLEKITLYDYKSFGNISYVDVSNPFIALIFYKDLNRLIFLDNFFSELRAPIVLDDIDLYSIDVICSSLQGGFWVYDSQNLQAVLIDKDLKKIQQGANLFSIVGQSNAVRIIESNNFLFIQFSNNQITVLDKFGNFYRNITDENIRFFDVFNDNIYLIKESELEILNVTSLANKIIKLPDIRIDNFKMSSSLIYILSGKDLVCFKIE